MPNIIFTGDLNFPIIDRKMETADGGTHENQVQANASLQCAEEQLWRNATCHLVALTTIHATSAPNLNSSINQSPI